MVINFVPRASKPAFAAFLALGVALTLAACGSSGTSSDNGGSTGGSTDAAATAKAAVAKYEGTTTSWPDIPKLGSAPDLSGKNIVYIPSSAALAVLQAYGNAMTEAMKSFGATVTICDGKANPTTMADCINNAVASKAAAIVTVAISYAQVPSAIDGARKAGVPVLVVGDTPSQAAADKTLAYYDTTSRLAAQWELAGNVALADHGAKTSILWTYNTDTSVNQNAAKQAIASFKKSCSTCKVTELSFSTPTLSQFPAAISAALVANPDVNALIIPTDSLFTQAQQGIQGAGGSAKPDVIGTGGSLAGVQLVASGSLRADVGNPLLYEGWLYSNALVRLLTGQTVEPIKPPVFRVFDSTSIGSVTLDQATFNSGAWYGDTSYKDKYLTAWGKK